MFNLFHRKKFSYNKGQIIPVFIVTIVIIIIMALITVNLNKVALTKTDTANAVDAGALAAGSAMAGVFNGIAQANSFMEAGYWEFFASVSVSFVIAYIAMILAYTKATAAIAPAAVILGVMVGAIMVGGPIGYLINCILACKDAELASTAAGFAGASATAMEVFISDIIAIMIAVTAFAVGQQFFYLSIRQMADEGRDGAIKVGHQFAFTNSGIGTKLKEGKPPEEIDDAEQKRNYRHEFSDFMDDLGSNETYTYAWKDGAERKHSVMVKVHIDPVDTYELKTAVLPLPVELAILAVILKAAIAIHTKISAAAASYTAAAAEYDTGCGLFLGLPWTIIPWLAWIAGGCPTAFAATATGAAANSAAITMMASTFPMMAVGMAGAWAGLLPGFTITDSGGGLALLFIICWIEDVVHNRLVRVDTLQHHEGADLGTWQTRYPDTASFSIVDFRGNGKIYPAKLNHDASIVQTDKLEVDNSPDPEKLCPHVLSRVNALTNQISELNASIQNANERVGFLEAEASKWEQQGMTEEANKLRDNAQELRQQAQDSQLEIIEKQKEITDYNQNYGYCFQGPAPEGTSRTINEGG